jgi:hypothetical protein
MAARQVDIGLKVPREQRSYARRSSFSECLRVDRFRANSPHEMSSTVEMAQDHLEEWPDRLSPGKSDYRKCTGLVLYFSEKRVNQDLLAPSHPYGPLFVRLIRASSQKS